jgi:molybdenum cofactor cytidylyltransferase
MKFERVAIERAPGHVLAHNVFHAGERTLGKGTQLGPSELQRLRDAGVEHVYIARLEPEDVLEDAAAQRIASALARGSRGMLEFRRAHTGRVTLTAAGRGVVVSAVPRLLELNRIEGVTLAVREQYAVVEAQRPVATLKIIPYALPEAAVARAEVAAGSGVVQLRPLLPARVVLLGFGARGRRAQVLDPFIDATSERLARLGTRALETEYVAIDADPVAALTHALDRHAANGCELVIVVGETASMDRDDLAPAAIRGAGGRVDVVGAPVFPGNLLVVGYIAGCAVLGAPGCARQPALNVVDFVLPRLLSGERITQDDVAALGLGGMIAR